MTTQKDAPAPETSPWETETGLPNDIDAWIVNPKFGYKDEYAQVVQASGGEGAMFIADLVDNNGELMGSQGYSIGTGWIISEDGLEISHPKRKNVVGATLYGQLQNRVRKELDIKMEEFGLPTQAKAWDGLGFHWMLQEHSTVGGTPKQGLMPVEFLNRKEGGITVKTIAGPAATAPVVDAALEVKLKELAQTNNAKDFQKAALKIAEVPASDELMASVLDEGPTGYHATHQ